MYGRDAPGNRFAPERLLMDPYARELNGTFSYMQHVPPNQALKACVVNETFDWQNASPPEISWSDSILYEIHIKGATKLHRDVPEALRGTYAGFASPAMLAHFRQLGITAVNLLPVQYSLDEERLVSEGLSNYWGYNTLGFFAPDPRYAASIDG